MQDAPIRAEVVPAPILGLDLQYEGVQIAKRRPGRGGAAKGKLLRGLTAQKGSTKTTFRGVGPFFAQGSRAVKGDLCL